MDPDEEVVELLRQLLAVHYIAGCVPLALVEHVEKHLKEQGKWFPDPQYPYHESQGYM